MNGAKKDGELFQEELRNILRLLYVMTLGNWVSNVPRKIFKMSANADMTVAQNSCIKKY